jgi:hypothetical protein
MVASIDSDYWEKLAKRSWDASHAHFPTTWIFDATPKHQFYVLVL